MKDDVYDYMELHLNMAEAKILIFSDTALEAIALRSQGWPRLVNSLTINSLLYGAQLEKGQINENIVQAAVEESGL